MRPFIDLDTLASTRARAGVQIKYIARVLKGTAPPAGGEKRPFFDYLLAGLRDRSDMVTFQAARTIAELKDVTVAELTPAISALQLYLGSGKQVLRFAAVRILNSVSMTQPVAGASAPELCTARCVCHFWWTAGVC